MAGACAADGGVWDGADDDDAAAGAAASDVDGSGGAHWWPAWDKWVRLFGNGMLKSIGRFIHP